VRRMLAIAMSALVCAILTFAPSATPTPADAGTPVWADVKQDACPTNKTTDLEGLSPLVCHKGIGSFEFGTSCLYIVTSKGAQPEVVHRDLSCVEACPGPDWKNDIPCDSKSDIKAFTGKAYFRNFAALPASARTEWSDDMTALKALVTAHDAKNTAKYNSLGGDAKRKSVQQDLVKIALEQMIPFAWSTRDASDDVHWIYELDYTGPVTQADSVNPFEWFGESNFELHESAFYIREKSGNLRSEDPNMIAATLLHEFLIHSRQFNRGNGEASAQANVDPVILVEDSLSEVVAYTVSNNDPFYKFALTPEQREDVGSKQINYFTGQFNENWPKLTQASKEQVAAWAWYCSGYMKNQLTRANFSRGGGIPGMPIAGMPARGGGAPSIWTQVCSAVKTGTGFCNLANKQPASKSCLQKGYF
jgi:hypothetical protein